MNEIVPRAWEWAQYGLSGALTGVIITGVLVVTAGAAGVLCAVAVYCWSSVDAWWKGHRALRHVEELYANGTLTRPLNDVSLPDWSEKNDTTGD